MRSYLYTITLTAGLAAMLPKTANASVNQPLMTTAADDTKVTMTVAQSTVVVEGAMGYTLEVVSITGRPVMKVKIESPSQRIDLNIPKGCYILKIDKVVRKVSIS